MSTELYRSSWELFRRIYYLISKLTRSRIDGSVRTISMEKSDDIIILLASKIDSQCIPFDKLISSKWPT